MKLKHKVTTVILGSLALYGLYQFQFFSNGASRVQEMTHDILTAEDKEEIELIFNQTTEQFRSVVSEVSFLESFERMKESFGSFESFQWKNNTTQAEWGRTKFLAVAEAQYVNATAVHKFIFMDSNKGTLLHRWDIQATEIKRQNQPQVATP